MASLKDKVVIITGSGDETGIGAAIARYLVQFQPKLVLTGRDRDRLERVGSLCKEDGLPEDRLLLVVADVNKDSDLDRLVEETVKVFKQIDVLVNNAAIIRYHTVLDTPMDVFDNTMHTNVRAPFYLTKLCLPHLINTKGNVVNISSISGQSAYTGEAAYGISKAALDQFTRILAMEMASHQVRVNTVSPGVTWSRIQRKGGMSDDDYVKYMDRQNTLQPMGRVGDPIEVAKAVTWLASDQSSFTTGQLLLVDGGRQIKSC